MPKLGARGLFLYGEPLRVPRRSRDRDVEHWRAVLEQTLDELTDAADREVGFAPEAPRPAVSDVP